MDSNSSQPSECGEEVHTRGSTSATASASRERKNRKMWTAEEKHAFWKMKKMDKKSRRRAARQEKNEREQEVWETLSEGEKEKRRQEAILVHEARRRQESEHFERCKHQLSDPEVPMLVFDLSFSWCMSAADTKSTIAQVKFSYSTLRKAGFPMRPVITSLSGKEAGEEHSVEVQAPLLLGLRDFEGFRKLPFPIHAEHWSEVFPNKQIVFLTADAEDVLQGVERSTIYVIGAFVDHNQHKRLSLQSAQRHGVRTARLPIKENIDVGNRCQILTINHVVELLTEFMTAFKGCDWKGALEAVLPVRRVHQEALGSRKRRRQRDQTTSEESEEQRK